MAKCNYDCFNCIYEDCILDETEIDLTDTQEMDIELDLLDELDRNKKQAGRKYYIKNRTYYLEYNKVYRLKNKQRIRTLQKKWYLKNKFKIHRTYMEKSRNYKKILYSAWMNKYKNKLGK